MQTELTNRPIFKASEETERLINLFRAMQPGQVVTWLEMQDAAKLDDRAKLRACISTARKHLLNDDQRCLAAVRGIGLKMLNHSEIVTQEGTTTRKVRRAVKASMRRLSTVKPDDLGQQEAAQYRMTSAALGAIALCVKPSSLDKVRQITLGNGQVDGKGVLALFGK